METNSLKKVFDDFINKYGFKAILIDGPWGCGKTSQFKKCLENKDKKGPIIIYQSLFGYESINEIHACIYKKLHPKKYKIKTAIVAASKTVSLCSEHINLNFGDALEYVLNSSKSTNTNIKKKTIIVLDDLERLSLKVSYKDFLGYITNTLIIDNNCRIISLMSEEKIANKKRQNDLNEFKEKVFDRIYKINVPPSDIIQSYFDKFNIKLSNAMFDLFKSNIRNAIKTSLFFDELLSYIDKKNKDIIKNNQIDQFIWKQISKEDMLIATIFAIIISFSTSKKSFKFNEGIQKYTFEECIKEYGEDFVNEFYSLKNKIKFTYTEFNMMELVYSLTQIFIYDDYKRFDDLFFINKRKENTFKFLDKYLFYLSDSNKKLYFKEFKDYFSSSFFEWNRQNAGILKQVMHYREFKIPDSIIKNICEAFIKSNKDSVSHFEWEITDHDDNEFSSKNKYFFDIFIKHYNDIKKEKMINKYKELIKEKKYFDLSRLLDEQNLKKYDEINDLIDFLKTKFFYMPNLKGDINPDLWSYCHAVAKFCASHDLSKYFIENSKKICLMHPKNKSLLGRYFALIYYNINSSFTKNDLLK